MNTKYRKLSLTKKMDVQFKVLAIKRLKTKLMVIGLYILDNNRYFYHVLKNMKEEFYIINENKCIKMKIKEKDTSIYDKDAFDYTCYIDRERLIDFTLYLNEDFEGFAYIDMNDKKISNKIDSYLYNMFYDIYRMKYSE